MNILSAAERTELEKPPVFSSVERKRFFEFPVALLKTAEKMRKPANRLGFLLMCGYFRSTRRFFLPGDARQPDIEYIARQIGGIGSKNLNPDAYGDRDRQRHQKIILEHYGFQMFDRDAERLLREEVADMMRGHLKPRLIFGRCLDFLIQKRVALPTTRRLTEIIRSELNAKKRVLSRIVETQLVPEQRHMLDALFVADDDNNRYRLTLLKKISQSTKPGKVKETIADFYVLSDLYETIAPVLSNLDLGPEGVRYYAGSVLKSEIFQLKRRARADRYLHIIAFVTHQYRRLHDVLADILLSAVQTFRNSAQRYYKEQVFERKKTQSEHVSNLLENLDTNVFSVLREIRTLAHHGSLSAVQKVNRIQVLLTQEREVKFDQIKADLQEDSDDSQYYQVLESRSLRLQNRVTPILKALALDAGSGHAALADAIRHFKETDGIIGRKVPVDFLDGPERKAVLGNNGREFKTSLYKAFLFLHVASAIKAGNLNLALSYKYRPLDDYLINSDRWKREKAQLLERAGMSEFTTPETLLKTLNTALQNQYKVTNAHAQKGENPHLKIMPDGTFRVATPAKDQVESEPLQSCFPKRHYVPLAQIIATVNQHCGSLEELTHWQQDHSRPISRKSILLAGVMGLGCGIGVQKMARISPGITERELEHAVTWRFSLDNLIAANDRVVKAMDQMELPNIYRRSPEKLHTASDGQKFEVRAESLNANHSFKYFGKGQGISAYTFTDERNLLWHSLVFSAAERESAYVIDGLMHNDVIKSDIHSTDTHGYSEAIFGVTHLLGFSYAPRIKNLKKQSLYQFKGHKLGTASKWAIRPDKYINQDIIIENWDAILRLVATIKLKETTASDIFRRLNSYSRQHSLYNAMKAFGQIMKTLFILRYIDDLELRQSIEAQLNKVELANRFTRAIAVGNPREYTQGAKEDQEIAEACNRLIKNSIICWNYLYLTRKLRQTENIEEREKLLKTIATHSPITWAHINMLGEYDFSDEILQDSTGILPPKWSPIRSSHFGGSLNP
jgi:TnpA family transposase